MRLSHYPVSSSKKDGGISLLSLFAIDGVEINFGPFFTTDRSSTKFEIDWDMHLIQGCFKDCDMVVEITPLSQCPGGFSSLSGDEKFY